ncbi:hypothetical protein Lesp02_05030 [Lentzea sp. NBRC 105346]|nr:hypothetical protein Lesp02_05030 [Lentzea sp. NBRC 105346]
MVSGSYISRPISVLDWNTARNGFIESICCTIATFNVTGPSATAGTLPVNVKAMTAAVNLSAIARIV